MSWVRTIACVVLVALSGCSLRSRYAMEDPVYAEKYADGAPKSDLLGKAKQALDARHTEQLAGWYANAGVQSIDHSESLLGGGEVGYEIYAKNWLTARGGVAAYANDNDGYIGVDLGLRLQTPTRIAPFIGVGLFNGGSKGHKLADRDGIDNDDDDGIDERGEQRATLDGWMTAVYPEIGVHAWLNHSVRVSGFGRYFVTTHGRDDDFWLVGGQVTIFNRY